MEDVLGFCALVMTVLMALMLYVWFCCSIVESFIKMHRGLKRAGYKYSFEAKRTPKELIGGCCGRELSP
jgi:hypothetical protein